MKSVWTLTSHERHIVGKAVKCATVHASIMEIRILRTDRQNSHYNVASIRRHWPATYCSTMHSRAQTRLCMAFVRIGQYVSHAFQCVPPCTCISLLQRMLESCSNNCVGWSEFMLLLGLYDRSIELHTCTAWICGCSLGIEISKENVNLYKK